MIKTAAVPKDKQVYSGPARVFESEEACLQAILDKKINGKMVTSLINDSRIVYSISKHLIKAAELLYLNTDVILADTVEE